MGFARTWTARLAVVFASALIVGGCAQGEEEAEPQTTPAGVLSIEADFNLTGTVTAVDPDTVPDEIDTWDDVDLPAADDAGRAGDAPDDDARLQVELQSFSDELADTCAAEDGETVDLWLTTDTDVVPGIDGDIEDLDGAFVSAQGSIAFFEQADATADPGAEGQVDAGDDTTDVRDADECVLIAEKVEVSQGDPADRAPTDTGDDTPEPTRTPGPDGTQEPERTSTPAATPMRTPSS